jgi:hypothetical protein
MVIFSTSVTFVAVFPYKLSKYWYKNKKVIRWIHNAHTESLFKNAQIVARQLTGESQFQKCGYTRGTQTAAPLAGKQMVGLLDQW